MVEAVMVLPEAFGAETNRHGDDTSGGWVGILSHEIERLVARRFGVAVSALRAAGRCDGTVALARHVAMYLERILLELSYDEIARRFLRHPTTVIYACRRVEDLRDDCRFDRRVAANEAAVAARAAERG
jgi:chromosomal replication initiation ATPase DnaA